MACNSPPSPAVWENNTPQNTPINRPQVPQPTHSSSPPYLEDYNNHWYQQGSHLQHPGTVHHPVPQQSVGAVYWQWLKSRFSFFIILFLFSNEVCPQWLCRAKTEWTWSRSEVKHSVFGFWMIKSVSELGFPISKRIRDFMITYCSIFNGQLACFFKLFISNVVFP